jgi:hypothetical protein
MEKDEPTIRQTLGTQFEDLSEGLREIARIATAMDDHHTEASRDLQDQTIAITQIMSQNQITNEHQHRETRDSIIEAIHELRTPSGRRRSIQKFPGLVPALKVAERDITLSSENSILSGLSFSTITDRYDEVEEAHLKTFEWIFERSPFKGGQQNSKKMRRRSGVTSWTGFVMAKEFTGYTARQHLENPH